MGYKYMVRNRFNAASLKSRWNALPSAARFIVGFVAMLAILAFVYPRFSTRFHGTTLVLMESTARVVALMSSPLVDGLVLKGRTIQTPGIAVEVIEECTGVYEILILWAAVLAFPATWRSRVIGILGGALALFAINLVRMTFLVAVGSRWPHTFDLLHTYFWQATLILMILTVWILWIRLIASRI
jgi:exosortase H (IPTLxxWG-CTERM-specific)